MNTIAQVGAFKRMSVADETRWLMAVTWMLDHRKLPHEPNWKHDTVNLKYGRDFLTEHQTYDVVVTHDIFWGNPTLRGIFKGRSRADRDLVLVSPLQTEEHWRERLVDTKARLIFVFETSPACMNGWKLGDLPGYVIREQDTRVTVYERIG